MNGLLQNTGIFHQIPEKLVWTSQYQHFKITQLRVWDAANLKAVYVRILHTGSQDFTISCLVEAFSYVRWKDLLHDVERVEWIGFQHLDSNSLAFLSFQLKRSRFPLLGHGSYLFRSLGLLQRIVGEPQRLNEIPKLANNRCKLFQGMPLSMLCKHMVIVHLISHNLITWLRFEGLRRLEQRNEFPFRVRQQSSQKVHQNAITHDPTAALDTVVAKSNGSKELTDTEKLQKDAKS